MGYQPLEELLVRSGHSIYKLVRMASQRATEIADGQPILIERPATDKTATIALEEILAGKVELKEVATQNLKKLDSKKNPEKDNSPEIEKVAA